MDLLAQRRLLQPEPGRSTGDVPLFSDSQEIPEMTQIHAQVVHT
jgi:hypothetical protein